MTEVFQSIYVLEESHN